MWTSGLFGTDVFSDLRTTHLALHLFAMDREQQLRLVYINLIIPEQACTNHAPE